MKCVGLACTDSVHVAAFEFIGLTGEFDFNPFTIGAVMAAAFVLGGALKFLSPSWFMTVRTSQPILVLLTAIWLVQLLQYLVPMILLMPMACLPVYGITMYRKLCGWYEVVARLGTMALPFSWCGCNIYLSNWKELCALKAAGNAVLLSTHCSRIDWIIGEYISVARPHMGDNKTCRVGFVAEATTALMPVIGWSRVLCGDIFVTRAFHKDVSRISHNIRTFHLSGIERLIFFAPEGFIADPGSEVGEKYILDCEAFMRKQGMEPLTHLLTPRYKGMLHFIRHSPDHVGSCSMAYVEDSPRVDFETARVIGGRNCSKPQKSPERSIPDLHSIFRGGMGVFIQYHPVKMDPDDPEDIKHKVMRDQQRKDADLRHFDKHRRYPGMSKENNWRHIDFPHIQAHVVLFVHSASTLAVWRYAFGVDIETGIMRFVYATVFIAVMHGLSHALATLGTGGSSKESLVGETAVKALLNLFGTLLARARGKKNSRCKSTLSSVEAKASNHHEHWMGAGADPDRRENTLLEEVSERVVTLSNRLSAGELSDSSKRFSSGSHKN